MNCIDFLNDLRSSDFESWILVQKEFLKNFYNENIYEIGFNKNSGYVYMALDNGITLASAFGYPVQYFIFDEDGNEIIYDDYQTLLSEVL